MSCHPPPIIISLECRAHNGKGEGAEEGEEEEEGKKKGEKVELERGTEEGHTPKDRRDLLGGVLIRLHNV